MTRKLTSSQELTRQGDSKFFAFAHNLNLIVQDGVEKIKSFQEKVKFSVIFLFLISEKLRMVQNQMGNLF